MTFRVLPRQIIFYLVTGQTRPGTTGTIRAAIEETNLKKYIQVVLAHLRLIGIRSLKSQLRFTNCDFLVAETGLLFKNARFIVKHLFKFIGRQP